MQRRYLFEAIKAKDVIPIIIDHLAHLADFFNIFFQLFQLGHDIFGGGFRIV